MVSRNRHANEDERMRGVECVQVVNEESFLVRARILGENAGQPRVVLFVERGAKSGGQRDWGVQVQFVGPRCVNGFNLCSEAALQFLDYRLQARQEVHCAPPIMSAARCTSSDRKSTRLTSSHV